MRSIDTDKVKISVVTVCRNAETSIENAIKSIEAQNYPNLEYIVIDGASTDRTVEIVKKYSHIVNHIISEPDQGISDAFNKGIRLTTGDVVAILNADDTLEPTAFQKVAEEYLKNPDTIVYGDMIYRDPETNSSTIVRPDLSKMNFEMGLSHIATFIPKKIYNQIGEYKIEYRLSMDYDFFIRCLQQGVKFHYTPFSFGIMNKGGAGFKQWNRALREIAVIQVRYKLDSKIRIKLRLYKRLIKDSIVSFLLRYNLNFLIDIYLKFKRLRF